VQNEYIRRKESLTNLLKLL